MTFATANPNSNTNFGENRKKALTYIGFAARSGKLVTGTAQVMAAVRKYGISGAGNIAVLLSVSASDRTKKQIRDKCAYYGVSFAEIYDGDELSRASGKSESLSAVCITDRNLAKALRAALDGLND